MDTRLIFRDLRRSYRCGDAAPRPKQAMVSCEAEGRTGEVNPPVRLPGKSAKGRRSPYHKPTQVVELNILRRSGDWLLRN